MGTVTYPLRGGGGATITYDENAPCRLCGYPVMYASMGGTDVCPWCDLGKPRPELGPEVKAEYERQKKWLRQY